MLKQMLCEASLEAQEIRASDFSPFISGHSLSEGSLLHIPLPFLAMYMRGKVVCATKKIALWHPPATNVLRMLRNKWVMTQ